MRKKNLLNFLRLTSTVFTFKELLLLSRETIPALLRRRISYYVKQKELHPIRRGLYAKDSNYDRYELATKIFTPAYVSFETILAQAGVIFQYYSTIFVASYQTKDIVCGGQAFSFKKLKDTILTNKMGIERRDNYYAASPERAFLDVLYLSKDYHFDNLAPLNKDKIFELLPLYTNKRMEQKVRSYFKAFEIDEGLQ